jgi:hypothetical protein
MRFSYSPEKQRTVLDRIALRQYDDFSFADTSNDYGSGGGDALSTILGAVGQGATAYAAAAGAPQYNQNGIPSVPQSSIYSGVSAHAPAMGNTSLIWIVVLIIVGFFAYREL